MYEEEVFKINGAVKDMVDQKIDPETGEIFDPNETAMLDFEALEMSRKAKQENVILYYRNLGGKVDIIDNEIARLQRLKTVVKNKQQSAKWLLEQSMLHNDERKVEFDTGKAGFRKNPPRLVIDLDADIKAYQHEEVVIKTDKAAIKKALKEGAEIKGCKLEQNERLDIK